MFKHYVENPLPLTLKCDGPLQILHLSQLLWCYCHTNRTIKNRNTNIISI